ncbi:MAG: tail fiber domain-containing protein [Candidatus Aminicenantales bacterium]
MVVFEAGNGETPAYEKIAANASPVLVKEIPGKALSWTPSADEPLLNGGSYVWYVGAMINPAQGSWSEGRKFIIAENPVWGVVSEPREKGIGAADSRQAPRDENLKLAAEAKESFNLTDDFARQEVIDIQGMEGPSNTFYGTAAGNATMTGANNSFFGNVAGTHDTNGNSNTFLGRAAGYTNTSGSENTFVGRAAGQYNDTASANTFLGYAAGYNNINGASNTFLGRTAGYSNKSGSKNTFIGRGAGLFNTASENTFVGYTAGYSNIFGRCNTFIGNSAGYLNGATGINGGYNTFVGYQAGYGTDTGVYNTCIGERAGFSNFGGNYNTSIGSGAGYNNKASGNVFIGRNTGLTNTAGWENIFIGFRAGEDELGSYKLYIHNGPTQTPLIYGDFSSQYLKFHGKVSLGSSSIVAPTHMLDVGVSGAYCDGGAWVDGSSRDYKENIEELTTAEAQQAFEKLEPVKFNYKENKDETYLGFIAEDVPDLVAMNDRKGLNPMDMVAMLTKVVQEQQKAIATLQEKISKLESALSIEK